MKDILEGYPPILNVEDVATILGVTQKTVRGLVKSKDIHVMRVGRLIRIPKNSLIDYIEHQTELEE